MSSKNSIFELYNEDRDHILITIADIIERKLRGEYDFTNEQIDDLFNDENWDKFENLFEPYTHGWRNYN